MPPKPTTRPKPNQKLTRDSTGLASSMQAAKKKILLVDDDMQIRKSLHKVLCAEGYDVILAANGQEGIRQFCADRFDLLLLDVSLPDMSGWEVFGTITSINPFLPIMVITGKDDQHDLAVLGGVGALIEKPLDVPRLLETVRELLAEAPEIHLQRLAGRRGDLRYEGHRAGGVI